MLHTEKLHGVVGRAIAVRTNDPAHATVNLTVNANVLASVEVFPFEAVHVSNRGPSLDRSMLLVRKDPTESGELAIGRTNASVAWLTVRGERLTAVRPGTTGIPTGQPGDWTVEVALVGRPEYGRHTAEVTFETGLAREPLIKIPVTITIVEPVTVSRGSVEIPWPAPEGEARGTVLVQVRPGLDPTTLQAVGEPETIHVDLERAGPRGFKLGARWSGAGPPEGAIVLRIGDESFRLPVIRAAEPSAP